MNFEPFVLHLVSLAAIKHSTDHVYREQSESIAAEKHLRRSSLVLDAILIDAMSVLE